MYYFCWFPEQNKQTNKKSTPLLSLGIPFICFPLVLYLPDTSQREKHLFFGSRFNVEITSELENPEQRWPHSVGQGSTNYSQRTKSGSAVHFCKLNFIGHPVLYVWSVVTFDLQQQSWEIIAGLSSCDKAPKPNILTIKTFTGEKKNCQPLF